MLEEAECWEEVRDDKTGRDLAVVEDVPVGGVVSQAAQMVPTSRPSLTTQDNGSEITPPRGRRRSAKMDTADRGVYGAYIPEPLVDFRGVLWTVAHWNFTGLST